MALIFVGPDGKPLLHGHLYENGELRESLFFPFRQEGSQMIVDDPWADEFSFFRPVQLTNLVSGTVLRFIKNGMNAEIASPSIQRILSDVLSAWPLTDVFGVVGVSVTHGQAGKVLVAPWYRDRKELPWEEDTHLYTEEHLGTFVTYRQAVAGQALPSVPASHEALSILRMWIRISRVDLEAHKLQRVTANLETFYAWLAQVGPQVRSTEFLKSLRAALNTCPPLLDQEYGQIHYLSTLISKEVERIPLSGNMNSLHPLNPTLKRIA